MIAQWWRRRRWARTPGLCPTCGVVMRTGASCTDGFPNAWSFGDEDFSNLMDPDDDPELWAFHPDDRCSCGVAIGGRHHPVCLHQYCRVCGDQAQMCEHAS